MSKQKVIRTTFLLLRHIWYRHRHVYTVLKNILELLFLYFHFISSSWKYHIQNISNAGKKKERKGEKRKERWRKRKETTNSKTCLNRIWPYILWFMNSKYQWNILIIHLVFYGPITCWILSLDIPWCLSNEICFCLNKHLLKTF